MRTEMMSANELKEATKVAATMQTLNNYCDRDRRVHAEISKDGMCRVVVPIGSMIPEAVLTAATGFLEAIGWGLRFKAAT